MGKSFKGWDYCCGKWGVADVDIGLDYLDRSLGRLHGMTKDLTPFLVDT